MARYPTPHSSEEASPTGSGRTQLVEIPRSEPGELPRSRARPPPTSPQGEGKRLHGAQSTASTLRREQRAELWKGAACSPLCPHARAEPFSLGAPSPVCEGMVRPPAGKPHSPPARQLQESLLAVRTPWLTGTCSVSPFLAAGNFLLSRCLAVQAAGFPSAGLAPRVPGCLPGGWKQLNPRREDSSPAPTAARASCNLSRAQPSREVPLLEKGPFPGAHGDTTEGSGAGDDVWPTLGEVNGTPVARNGVQREV